MTPELQSLTDAVTQANTVEASAVTLIQGLAAQIAANQNNPAAISALAAQLKSSSDALAAAITANTTVTPPPPPGPTPAA